ncbi:MAG: molybdopterin-dependent oxidoreductase [Clostridiaceae bacterium]|nr:molybdopterin-dependent oxidoreductase [Clostridiaceae bacterium]
MKRNKIYAITLFIFLIVVSAAFWTMNDTRKEKAMIKEILPQAGEISEVKEALNDPFILENFPAIEKVYSIDGLPAAFLTSGTGYVGTIKALVVIDNEQKKTSGIRILEQGDTPDYADPIMESWFTKRFKGLELLEYLNLVVLDPERHTDIVQVTGASVSSQAVLNNVNSAIGAWNYLIAGIKKDPVENAISQEMWEKDENSFLISWPENNSARINVEDLKDYPQVTTETILQKTTGVKIDITASGPLLADVLKKNGIDINAYEAIGITGRDNYYTMISKDIIQNRDIILGTEFNGKEILREEKPIRIVVPDEMGVYWVKMVNNIDLYTHISPKNIENVYIFDALTRDIEPYYYEYYGSKDKSFLVGKILSKFPFVDPNGFFTMAGSDGLIKNETLSMVRDRYYIKTEGNNAPMNISPSFKLGMNVKKMSYFSTTTDSVIFSDVMMKVIGEESISQGKAMQMKEALEEAGMVLESGDELAIMDTSGKEYPISKSELESSYLIPSDSRTDAIIGSILIKDVQKVSKIQ